MKIDGMGVSSLLLLSWKGEEGEQMEGWCCSVRGGGGEEGEGGEDRTDWCLK